MIVTAHLLCRRGMVHGGSFYKMIIQLHALLCLGACSHKKILKISAIWCVFVYMWIRFCLK